MLNLFHPEMNFKNRTSFCSFNKWRREKQWMSSCQVILLSSWSLFQLWRTWDGCFCWALLLAWEKRWCFMGIKDMPAGGIILIVLLLGGEVEIFQKVFPESQELQAACWGAIISTASTINQIQLHLKSINIAISFKHTCKFHYKMQK